MAVYATPSAASRAFDTLFGSLGEPPAPSAKSAPSFSNPIGTIGKEGVTSGFGHRSSPMGIGSRNHGGIDMAARGAGGGYAAEAAAGGTVTYAGKAGGYGNLVEVTHEDGSKTRYGHLQSIDVAIGDQVARGTPVGKVGSSGRSTGPHLHFEVIDKTGKKVDPRSITDLTNRSLSVTPTPRPGSLDMLMSYDTTTPAPSPSLSMPDASRFGPSPDINPSRFGGLSSLGGVSAPVSPMGGYAAAEAPTGFGMPSADRFGPAASAPSPERFGRTPPSSFSGVSTPFSPVGDYAVAEAPPAPQGMASTATTGRLSSHVTPASATPMAASQSQPMSSGFMQDMIDAGVPTQTASLSSVAPSSMGLLPSPFSAPVGPFSAFTPTAPLSVPVKNITPSLTPSAVASVAPMITPAALPARTATVGTPAHSPTPTPRPSFSASQVRSGAAPVGYEAPATGGNTVSRDQFGNVSVTNKYGATTVTDPSGRQMGNLGGLNLGKIGDAVPGMVGSAIGGAMAGPLGAIAGGLLGNKAAGKKSGGLGGLGGFLGGLFGGGNGGSRGGGSSNGGSRGGGSRGGPAGRDRDHSGN